MNPKKQNHQRDRLGDISDAERAAAQAAYAQHTATCKRVGCEAEPFDRYLAEFVEDFRAPTLETITVDLRQPRRDYELQFNGLAGFDGHGHYWER